MPQAKKLFFVRADNDDGENLDLLVVAQDKPAAEAAWRTHYELSSDDRPNWVGDVPGVTPDASCEEGAIDWEAILMD